MMIAYLSGKDTFELNIVEQQKREKKSCGCGIVIIFLRSIIFDEILFFSGVFFLPFSLRLYVSWHSAIWTKGNES